MSAFPDLTITLREGIQLITINRPLQLNALNSTLLTQIERAIINAETDRETKGVILTGSGDKAFVAGADIKEFSGYTSQEGREMVLNGQRVYAIIEHSTKPFVAAINGIAFGGGCELAMACHLRVATDTARFAQPEVNLGIIPGYGGTQRLIQLIGKTKAIEMMLTGKSIDAAEAYRLGMLNAVVSREELLPYSYALLRSVLEKAPVAIAGVIDCVNAYYDDARNGYEAEINNFEKCCTTADFKEGTAAFLEKRSPRFTGQ